MKRHRLAILVFASFVSLFIQGQLFKPLGLGIETPNDWVTDFQPQMYVEGNILYVCTKQGLYSKDLSKDESEWQLVGFEGIPILDYVRRGEDIFALCFNDQKDIFLLSHDSGQTYEDVTPDDFRSFINREGHTFWYFNQHPTDPDAFLLTSYHGPGMFMTTDFGQTWEKLADYTPDYMGFHPLTPEIIYECGGGGFTDEKTDLRISYDGGQTWQDKTSCFPDYGTLYRMAFHPTDPDKWIVGGKRCLYTTDDGGKTWDTQSLNGDGSISDYYDYYIDWRYAAYDNEDADIIYMAGGHQTQHMKLMCSTDGGKTWNRPYMEPIKTTPTEYVFDMKQYGDKLLIYSQSDVYEILKAELIEHKTSVQINETNFPDENFRKWVLANSFGRDGVLTDAEIASVTKLSIGSRRIQSLKGIEFFTETSWLDVGGNGITEIDLSPFPKMTHLDIGWCKIKELDLSKNTALTYLDCRGNGLTTLDLSKNTSLTTLICFGNQLTELDLSKNTLLTEIECQNNLLTELDVSKNLALEKLECMENQLTALDVSQHTALKYLTCYNNLLNSLDLSGCAAMISLKCNSNHLMELDLTDCSALLSLYCMNNQLTTLDVSTNARLDQLYCQQNNLTKLNVSNNKEIWCLYCYDNQLTELDVSNVTDLYHLRCYRNKLTALNMSGNPSLINLYCYSNQIKGEAMDALLESMHTIGGGDIYGFRVINSEDEQNVMTKAQVAAAKAKGWKPLHHVGGYSWQEYEGSDPTGLASPLWETGEGVIYDLSGRKIWTHSNSPLKGENKGRVGFGKLPRGIYIENGQKRVIK